MALELRKAHRAKAFLRLGISAPSGGGKTASSLLLAYGLLKEAHPDWTDEQIWEKVAIIDSENRSGELYVGATIGGTKIGEYCAVPLEKPYEAEKYIQGIELCEKAGMEVCIIDSSSHLWMGEGGLLEQQSNVAKRTGNSYTAWRDITPMHNRFVESMLQSHMHIIATMRAKQEYVQEKDEKSGKNTVRKLGMEPEQRKGMEYEFTTFFEISADHTAFGSKDRTSMFDQKSFVITPKIGQQMMKWLLGGTDEPNKVIATSVAPANPAQAIETLKEEVIALCKSLGGSSNPVLMDTVKKYASNGNPNSIKDSETLSNLKTALVDMKTIAQKQDVTAELETA